MWPDLTQPQRAEAIKSWNIKQKERNRVRSIRGLPEWQPRDKLAEFDNLMKEAMQKLHPDAVADAPAMACIELDDPMQVLFSMSASDNAGTRSHERSMKRFIRAHAGKTLAAT